ncbi:MAG: sigma-70 family RNA polymerase sigma factor [Gemmatales bacterium]
MVATPLSLLEQLSSKGGPVAWDRFVQLYTPLLRYWCRKLCPNEAQASDFLQDLYVKLLRALPGFQYQKDKRFRGWLWTLTLNLWRDQHRQQAVRLRPHPDLPGTAITPPEQDELDEDEYRRYLINRMMELIRKEMDNKSWQACWQVACLGRPVADVAAELGITPNAVYIARCRVIKRIREELKGLVDDI